LTGFALVSSIIISVGSLAWGYSDAGLDIVTRWILILGLLWLFTPWNSLRWFSSPALILIVLAAGFGLWFGLQPGWLFSSGIFALIAWDLTRFRYRLHFIPAKEDKRGVERRHIARLSFLSWIGLFLASITMLLRGQFSNDWGNLLITVLVLELTQFIAWIRRQ
jgi:hypothetical protein